MSKKFLPGVAPTAPSTPTTRVATAVATEKAHVPSPAALVPGSVTAQVLARVWRGGECTIVDSPPGAGKTALITSVTAHLATRAEMRILIGTPTRAQALALANRLVQELPVAKVAIEIKDVAEADYPAGYRESRTSNSTQAPPVTITTLAKAKFLDKSAYHLFIVDEAYQATWALVAQAMAGVPQILMVGDPGQIGPVVTVDTSIWAGQKDAPHLPAPLVTQRFSDVQRLSINTTYRLGAQSAATIAPVYSFEFSSGAPVREVVTNDGEVIDEVASVEVSHSDEVDNLPCLLAMVERAARFVGGTMSVDGEVRTLFAHDIALVVSRNSQVSILAGMSRSIGHEFTIGTADRLQGGEWPVVVALDPMYGVNGDHTHNQSLGRLCVMLSRHQGHLSWLHDDSWVEGTAGTTRDAKIGRKIRKILTKNQTKG